MKIKAILMLALMAPAAWAGNLDYTRPALTLKNDTLTLQFTMSVADVHVNSQQTYAFTPVLRSGKNFRALPPVIVTGRNGDYHMRRKERRMARRSGFDAPYTVIHGRLSDRRDRVEYSYSMPYEEWMNHASMLLLQEGRECCETDLLDITVIQPDVAVEEPALPAAGEFCRPCMDKVTFLEPHDEGPKVRAESSTLFLQYPTGGTEFQADYKQNNQELDKLKQVMSPLQDGDLVTFKSIRVCGYASPDGSARTNDRVANLRAASFGLHMKGSFHFPDSVLHVTSAGEDWDGLRSLIQESRPDYADKVFRVIDTYQNVDVREARLKTTLGPTLYRTMMNTYYPRLRRLSIEVDYEVREVTNAEAARLIYTEPKMLSLQEMYRVANMYRPGTKEYKEAYQIAADTYPQDVVANINAASATLVSGDFDGARTYIERVKDDPRAWNNLGVMAWLTGNNDEARAWFEKAAPGDARAKANLDALPAE